MNRYLLDTNVISELRKPRPHGGVVAWINDLQEEQLFLSAVTMGKLQAGIERTRRQDPLKAAEIESWADQLAMSYQILPMDTPCFREWGRIIDRKSDELFEDAMIAATARVHQLIVATRNEADFKRLDIRIFNPIRRGSALTATRLCALCRLLQKARLEVRLTAD
jgi:predicted nucleic acid-binding protein